MAETLIRLREEYDVPPEYVPLELTESAFLEDEAGMYRRMEACGSGASWCPWMISEPVIRL